MRAASLPVTSSNRHSSTRTARCEYTAKLVPWPSHVDPRGSGQPGQTVSGGIPEGLTGRERGEGDRQPVGAIVHLVQHFVGGLFELERGEGRRDVVGDELRLAARDRKIRVEERLPRGVIPVGGNRREGCIARRATGAKRRVPR